jgi:hypothetical protein
MHFRRCGSMMAQTHTEVSAQSTQTWYECTLCRGQILTSQPASPYPRMTARGPLPRMGETDQRGFDDRSPVAGCFVAGRER